MTASAKTAPGRRLPIRAGLVTTALLTVPFAAQAQTNLLNVSYDPTRELYREYNALFTDWWTSQGNEPVTIQ